jgi:hypothetical protein
MELNNDRYYKILQGYEHERDVIIREDELDKAYGLFMLGGRAIFSGGPVDGKNIQTIVEDYHTTMGWNKEYKLGVDDYADMAQKKVDYKMKCALSEAKERVNFLINSGQADLIGKTTENPILENKENPKKVDGVEKLAKSMQIDY